MIFSFFKKNGFFGILGPPSYGIGAIIRIGRDMLCLPYAGFFSIACRVSLFLNESHTLFDQKSPVHMVKGHTGWQRHPDRITSRLID